MLLLFGGILIWYFYGTFSESSSDKLEEKFNHFLTPADLKSLFFSIFVIL